jgi:hypothetical protein
MTDRVIHSKPGGWKRAGLILLWSVSVVFPVAIQERGGGIRNLLSQAEGETRHS